MEQRTQFYIDGQWIAPAGKGSIEVFSPTDGALLATVPQGNAADADAAVMAARRAFDGWSRDARRRARRVPQENPGRPQGPHRRHRQAPSPGNGHAATSFQRIQVGSPTASFGMYSKMLADFAFEEKVGNSLVVREAVGVVAAITPWNYPLHQIAAKVAAALAAGCTVVLKPSEVAPLNAFILAEMIHAAGVPAGVFNLVTGYGPVVGEALVTHKEVDMVSFTGSTRAGKRVSELASATVKRVALELGGKSAAVILDDADFNVAVKRRGRQRLLSQLRPDLHRTRACWCRSRATPKPPGSRPKPPQVTASAIPWRKAPRSARWPRKCSRTACASTSPRASPTAANCWPAAPTARGVNPDGYYVKPTVFGKVKWDATIAQEEIFGPVLSIIAYRTKTTPRASPTARSTASPAASGPAATSAPIAFARRMRTGQVDINGGTFNLYAPFGGYKQSGNGRELGKYGLEDFLEYKAHAVQAGAEGVGRREPFPGDGRDGERRPAGADFRHGRASAPIPRRGPAAYSGRSSFFMKPST
jgi:acyl-CoA reductase-like NAD-dependent aldehyde dehydrogenase